MEVIEQFGKANIVTINPKKKTEKIQALHEEYSQFTQLNPSRRIGNPYLNASKQN